MRKLPTVRIVMGLWFAFALTSASAKQPADPNGGHCGNCGGNQGNGFGNIAGGVGVPAPVAGAGAIPLLLASGGLAWVWRRRRTPRA
jgi:hypothetical protein